MSPVQEIFKVCNDADWCLMQEMIDVLKPIAMTTKFVPHRQLAFISTVLPLCCVLAKELDKDGPLREVRRRFIKSGLENRRMNNRDCEKTYHCYNARCPFQRHKVRIWIQKPYFTTQNGRTVSVPTCHVRRRTITKRSGSG